MFDLATVAVEGRREREFLRTIVALRDVAKAAETDATPATVKARMQETLAVRQMFDDWYRDMSRLPRGVQMMILKLGARIALFIPKG